MSGFCDNLIFENSIQGFEQKAILQALTDIGLLNNERISLELTNQAVNFAKTEDFNFSQLCGLVSVINRILKEISSSPHENIHSILNTTDKMMLSYSIQRPPHYIELFSISNSIKSVDFFVDVLFKHWKLYKFALAPTARLVPLLIYDGNDYESQEVDLKPSGTGLLYAILKHALEDQMEANKCKTMIRQ
ncbi:unnamed protein product [Trichobilharzia szidati]|nr:unnamed protein product [Trichobilharzia szidati]